MFAFLAWFSTKSITAGCFLCASFVLAGGGSGRLFYEFLRQSRDGRREKASASRSRFRAVLANELRIQPLEVVKFLELVSESEVAREDADRIADELFGKVIGKFLADAILTDRERAKLEALAHTLEINPARAKRLEAEAKSEHYRKAVSDALADGTVTAAEAHMLNELKAQARYRGFYLDTRRSCSSGMMLARRRERRVTWQGTKNPDWRSRRIQCLL